MRPIFLIAWKDLRQRMRDRSAIIAAFVAPIGIALIVSGAFGSGFTDNFHATYVVVDQDGSELTKAFAEQVLGATQFEEQIDVMNLDTVDEARTKLERDEVTAAFVFPSGFTAKVLGNSRSQIQVLRNAEAQIGGEVARAIATAFTDQINASRLSVVTATNLEQQQNGAPPSSDRIAALARRAATARIPIRLVDGQIGVRKITGANYFGPAMAVFSLFFTTAFVARSMIAEREVGTLPRILATPVPRASLILGKSASAFVLGIASFIAMFSVFGLLLDTDWGDPLALVVVTVSAVFAVMGLMTVMQSMAKTQASADAMSTVITMTLSLLGGSFFPLFQMPELMQKLAFITPNGAAIRAYTDIAYDGATLTDVLPNVGVIAAFAVVTGAIGIVRARRLV